MFENKFQLHLAKLIPYQYNKKEINLVVTFIIMLWARQKIYKK